MKNHIRISLLVLVVGSVVYWGWNRFIHEPAINVSIEKEILQSENPVADQLVTVTYFTTDVRCESCRKIEDWTRKTVESRFADELQRGDIAFRIRNIDLAENAHFIEDYNLVFKTVVISQDGREEEKGWQKMDQVWQLLGDQDAFENYLSEAIQEALAGQLAPRSTENT